MTTISWCDAKIYTRVDLSNLDCVSRRLHHVQEHISSKSIFSVREMPSFVAIHVLTTFQHHHNPSIQRMCQQKNLQTCPYVASLKCHTSICSSSSNRKRENVKISALKMGFHLEIIFPFFPMHSSHLILAKDCKICIAYWHGTFLEYHVQVALRAVHRVTATLLRCFYCVAVTCNRRQDFIHTHARTHTSSVRVETRFNLIQRHAFYIDLFASKSLTLFICSTSFHQ